ncbi:Fe-S cluster assembly protein SufD [Georgenia faecalis]|uniref:Fe-S cluster assembly protein SufD n=1 Tax=Georgenia faecalis TaxID=2483799 RepID=UPI000FD9E10B|nr:Fe-S cluster assembly protein SufD [Georgenia faecalis]
MTTPALTNKDPMTTDHSRATADSAHTHGRGGTPEASRAERTASFDAADFPVPHGREEEWRFTPVDKLQRIFAGEPSDGRLALETSLPEGVLTSVVPAAEIPALTRIAPGDRAAVLAATPSEGAYVVDIPANLELVEPVVLDLSGVGTEPVVYGHVVVRVGANARATVVVRHTGSATYDERLTVQAADGAHLTFVTLQEWDADAVHLSENVVEVAKDATVRHIVVTLGGDVVRVSTTARFEGTGGDVELLGLYFTDSGQHQEHRLFVDHAVPSCRSNATYKGALQGEGAHSVWVGDVLIRAEAEGTDTYELNRNLVLTEGARADSVPNLEIETGEIEGAGHASATGRFDDEQLFYLRSRGIPEAEARRLVVRGFFAELINQIGVPLVQERLLAAIEAELDRTMEVQVR